MINHIKQELKSTSQQNAKKVDALFGNMKISYIQRNGNFINVVCGHDLARGITHTLKHQRANVL